MKILDNFVSNTLAANGNQTFFKSENPKRIQTGMIFIKVYKGGTYPYAFAFSSIIDSTFSDGSISVCNDVCPAWTINSLSFTITETPEPKEALKNNFNPVLFDNCVSKLIDGDSLIHTDTTEITAKSGQYLCLKIVFSGEKIPCHEESMIAIFRESESGWIKSPKVPLPIFTGIKREVKNKIAFLGDSITQGIGADFNSYMHYAARIAEIIGDDYGYWDLGIGFARAADAATDGVWLNRAKHNDVITVCFGVNDIYKGRTANQIITDLQTITDKLHDAGLKVIVQTIPPFDYFDEYEKTWNTVNEFIRNNLSKNAEGFLDVTEFLSIDGDNSPTPKYGGHPNNEGNGIWAQNLAPVIKETLRKSFT